MLESTVKHLTSSEPSRTYEILIVDDGSSDGTADFALKLANTYKDSDIRVIVLEKNLGKGGAVRHGMLFGRGRRLLMVDADGASRFEDIELLWSALDQNKEDAAIAIGSRAHLVKTEAVVKVCSLFTGAEFQTLIRIDSVLSFAIFSCMDYTPFFVSSASATFAILSVVSNCSLVEQRNRYSPVNTSRRGYLTSSCYSSQSSLAFQWKRCLSSGMRSQVAS